MGRGKSVSGICDGCQINFTCIQHCRNAVLIDVYSLNDCRGSIGIIGQLKKPAVSSVL